MNVPATIAGLRRRFRAAGTPERARFEKAYLKSDLQFHGVTVPLVRAAAAEIARGELDRAELRALVDGLYATPFHDLRSAAVAVLERKQALLGARDLPWLIGLARTSAGWAQVDWLAIKVVGPIVGRLAHPGPVLRRWARDRDLWVRRTALLAQLDELRAGGGDFLLFEAIAAPMGGETELFIRKAIGWVLREVSRRRPALTVAFLQRHAVSPLTLREASRHLPPRWRAPAALYWANGSHAASGDRGVAGGRVHPRGAPRAGGRP
jgi:3-methyladenine DNA glycosylase AlkD